MPTISSASPSLYKERVEKELGKPFPGRCAGTALGRDRRRVRHLAIARAPTPIASCNNIPEEWGTAVTVQAMVFGNRGETSATGVAFTRDPATGEKLLYGEFLINAQGEDVVAGIRTPQPISKIVRERQGGKKPSMEEAMPKAYAELKAIGERLEAALPRHAGRGIHGAGRQALHAADPLRQAHRGSGAESAVDMVGEGLIDKKIAVAARRCRRRWTSCCIPRSIPTRPRTEIAIGLGASPGAATGEVVFTAEEAEKLAADHTRRDPGAHRNQPGRHSRHACGQAAFSPRAAA